MRIGFWRIEVEQARAGQIGAISYGPLQTGLKPPSLHWQKHPAKDADGRLPITIRPSSPNTLIERPIVRVIQKSWVAILRCMEPCMKIVEQSKLTIVLPIVSRTRCRDCPGNG
jgi:hypothetical protein